VEIYQIVPLYILVAKIYHLSGFHTSLKMTPFQALYAFPPPHVAETFLADDTNEDAETMLQRRQEENITIKANLQQAQERMVHYANKNRSDRQLQPGDMVTSMYILTDILLLAFITASS
jgi:hypothetical protein